METKHTPDPLPPISCDLGQRVTFQDTDGRTETVVELVNRDAGLTVAYAVPEHAEFIVRACNSHHELLEELTRVASWMEQFQAAQRNGGNMLELLQNVDLSSARSAISKATR